jgi:hypothetical protein
MHGLLRILLRQDAANRSAVARPAEHGRGTGSDRGGTADAPAGSDRPRAPLTLAVDGPFFSTRLQRTLARVERVRPS